MVRTTIVTSSMLTLYYTLFMKTIWTLKLIVIALMQIYKLATSEAGYFNNLHLQRTEEYLLGPEPGTCLPFVCYKLLPTRRIIIEGIHNLPGVAKSHLQ